MELRVPSPGVVRAVANPTLVGRVGTTRLAVFLGEDAGAAKWCWGTGGTYCAHPQDCGVDPRQPPPDRRVPIAQVLAVLAGRPVMRKAHAMYGEGTMKRSSIRVSVAAAFVLAANLVYGYLNPVKASMPGCGEICTSSSVCYGWCWYCLPNPIHFPGTCVD